MGVSRRDRRVVSGAEDRRDEVSVAALRRKGGHFWLRVLEDTQRGWSVRDHGRHAFDART